MILEINPIEIKQTNSMQIELINVMPKPLASIQHGHIKEKIYDGVGSV